MDKSGVALVLIGPGSIDQVCPEMLHTQFLSFFGLSNSVH